MFGSIILSCDLRRKTLEILTYSFSVIQVKSNHYVSNCFKLRYIIHIKQTYTYGGESVESYLALLYYVTFNVTDDAHGLLSLYSY